MKTILMCRVSSKEQEETGYSLDAQEKLLTEYAQKKELEIAKIFKISESASGKQIRKLFNEVFKYATDHHVDIVCCEKIDRLTRNMKDAAMVQDWIDESITREVHFLKESFVLNRNTKAHESLVWDMKVAIARFYTNNLSEEVRKGQKEKVAQGWLPTKPPLGYQTTGDKGHKTHIIDPVKGPFIRKMFELYSTGNYSVTALVALMYKEGLRSRIDKKLGKSRMHDMLSDPFYYGDLRWKDEVHHGMQEPLITKELFELVQKKMSRKEGVPQFQKHLPVFKAKMTCGGCGGTVTWEIQRGHWYGHCNHYKPCTQKDWWRQEKVEGLLFPLFDKVAPKNERILKIIEKAIKETHVGEIDYNTTTFKALTREIETTQKRLEAIYEDKIDKKISAEFYEKKFKEYTKAKEAGLEALEKLNEGNTQYYLAGYAIHELASRATDIYKSSKATVEEKRLLLSKIFSNLSLEADDIRPNYTLAFEFLQEWMPKLNESFEHQKTLSPYGQKGSLGTELNTMLRGLDDVRTVLLEGRSEFFYRCPAFAMGV
jgi:site-specific DNA recombinase